MPRLDNSDQCIVDTFGLEYDEGDPGQTDPVDVCRECYEEFFAEKEEIDHPPYGEMSPPYFCEYCGVVLLDQDH